MGVQNLEGLYLCPMLDYLIVGSGLAGISFAETLRQQNKSYKVISDQSQQASLVAGGLYNPVILKRFTLAWKAHVQLALAIPFYQDLEKELEVHLDYKIPVFRKFASVEEQNLWFEAADRPNLNQYLNTRILENTNTSIHAPFGLGEVRHTGRIDVRTLIFSYQKFLQKSGTLIEDPFDYRLLEIGSDYLNYGALKAKYIVFAEGFGLKHNPYFNYLPLNGTKGELLTIKAPGLKENHVVKSSVFIIPLGNDNYRVGATYKWKDKTNKPTVAAKKELLEKLRTLICCDFEVIDHVAGVRPTVTDRRPLVGQHPEHKNLYVLNGFGSRGVLIAPFASQKLYGCIENGIPIDSEMDVARFASKYSEN